MANPRCVPSGPIKRTEPRAVRVDQILGAAKQCFRKAGFHATKMDDIAHKASVSIGLVYRCFPSKEIIIEEIIRRDLERQKQFFASILSETSGDPQAVLEALAKSLTTTIFDFDRSALMLEIAAETARNPSAQALGAQAHLEITEMLRAKLAITSRTITLEEAQLRVQLLAGFITGVALQLCNKRPRPSPSFVEAVQRTAKTILQS
jgi:AcrR family transcriptional regulator